MEKTYGRDRLNTDRWSMKEGRSGEPGCGERKETAGADTLHEECGVFGIYDFDGGDVASTIYYGLFALQHRGQESCGIAVSDTDGPKGKVDSYKGMGLVNEVFTQENLEGMHGDIGVACAVFAGRLFHARERTASGAQLCKGNPGAGPQR